PSGNRPGAEGGRLNPLVWTRGTAAALIRRMPITLPKSPEMTHLKQTLKEVARGGTFFIEDDVNKVQSAARGVAEQLKSDKQINVLYDKIERTLSGLKVDSLYDPHPQETYAKDMKALRHEALDDLWDRKAEAKADKTADKEFP